MIDYDVASHTYDNTRDTADEIIQRFAEKVPFLKNTSVLDFGCGTGNYLNSLQLEFGCRCCGVEPSNGMIKIAREKNSSLDIRSGDHNYIPFENETFDFSFMTDVIHHVPDLKAMFLEIQRVLKPDGLLCIITESHEQIQNRFYNHYFPSLSISEKRRYPDISKILDVAESSGFLLEGTEVLLARPTVVITERIVKNAVEKNFSMFHYLDDLEYMNGIQKLNNDLGKLVETIGAGETLIWMRAPYHPSIQANHPGWSYRSPNPGEVTWKK